MFHSKNTLFNIKTNNVSVIKTKNSFDFITSNKIFNILIFYIDIIKLKIQPT